MDRPAAFDTAAHVLAFCHKLGEAKTVADMRRVYASYPVDASPLACTVMRCVQQPSGTWIGDPRDSQTRRGVYFHGGGYVAGSTKMYAGLVSRLAVATRSWIFIPDILPAPEQQFPSAHDTAIKVCRFVSRVDAANNRVAANIFLVGDSCGAALALSTAMRFRDEISTQGLSSVVGLCPVLDMEATDESYDRAATTDRLVSRETTRGCIALYAPDVSPRDARLSPIHGQFEGLPPILLQTSETEAAYGDSLRAQRIGQQQRRPVLVQTWPDLPHVWHLLAPVVPEAAVAIEFAARFIRESAGD